MNELVSVIIPVFNIKNYIEKCIESVVQQNYRNIEIIIVDDGSTDGSGESCRQFADKDSRIKYIYQENQGSVGARKAGLIQARGKYIVFVDGDDYAEINYIEKLYKVMIENAVEVVHSNYMVDGKNQKHIKQVHLYREKDLDLECRVNLLRDNVFEWNSEKEIIECNLYGCIYKKDVIYDCFMELPDSQQYGEDLLCLCNLIMKSKSMMFIPDAYYHYVIREESLNHPKDFMKALSSKVALYKELKGILGEYDHSSVLLEKCQVFLGRKILLDFGLISSEEIQIKEKYLCGFTDLLMGKKIVLYGAGVVGQNIYEQLTNFESIKIVEWVDSDYKNACSIYRNIASPELINTLEYDYIIVAVKRKKMAEEIIDYLSQMNIDRKLILWRPYCQSTSLSMC